MTLTEVPAAVPSIDLEQRQRRIRRWTGITILVSLVALEIATGIVGDRLDARESVLLNAWNASWTAAAIWLLTDLRRWFWKLFFGLAVLASVGSASQGLGFWYSECFHHYEATETGSTSGSYCLPHLGSSPEFR